MSDALITVQERALQVARNKKKESNISIWCLTVSIFGHFTALGIVTTRPGVPEADTVALTGSACRLAAH